MIESNVQAAVLDEHCEEEGVGHITQRKVAPEASDSEELGDCAVDSFIGSLVGGLSGLCKLIPIGGYKCFNLLVSLRAFFKSFVTTVTMKCVLQLRF